MTEPDRSRIRGISCWKTTGSPGSANTWTSLRNGVPDREQSFGIEMVFVNGTPVYAGGQLDEATLKTTGRAIPVFGA